MISRQSSTSFFNNFLFCESCLKAVKPEEVISSFSEGFFGLTSFLYALLYTSTGLSILQFSAIDSSKFLCVVLQGIHRAIAVEAMTPSSLLSILDFIHPNSIKTLLPLLLPHLPALASSGILASPTFERLVRLLPTSRGSLVEYAARHAMIRSLPIENKRTIIVESAHPYPHNANIIESWDFPGANEIVIEFDPKSATERGCDILEIYTNSRRERGDLLASLHGGSRNECWRQRISTAADHITFRFVSDRSVNDWGYKATIRATFSTIIPFSSPPFEWDLYRELIKVFGKKLPNCPDWKLMERGGEPQCVKELLPGIQNESEVPVKFAILLGKLKGSKLTQGQVRELITAPDGCILGTEEERNEQRQRVTELLERLTN
jgi:hypothetical protein